MLNDENYFGFERLEVCHLAVDSVAEVYTLSEEFPVKEQFGLTSQIRRPVNSIAFNIAEGRGHGSDKEFLHFPYMARGSLLETVSATHVAERLSSSQRNRPKYKQASILDGKLNALIRTLEASSL